jgi:superfamily II DNA/RNA helicase
MKEFNYFQVLCLSPTYELAIHFQVLCLSPTYELAIQTGEVVAKMAQFCPEIKIRFAVRGEESE